MTPRDVNRHTNVRVDSAINDAASRFTNAKPSDALRANVMSRIAVGNEQTSRFPWRVVFAGGAIASIALVTFLSWPHNAAIRTSTIPNLTIPAPTIPTPTLINPTVINSSADPTASAHPPSPLTSMAQTVAANGGGPSALAMASGADETGLVPALEHPELLTIDPLLKGVPLKAVEPMRVVPLAVPAIDDDNQ